MRPEASPFGHQVSGDSRQTHQLHLLLTSPLMNPFSLKKTTSWESNWNNWVGSCRISWTSAMRISATRSRNYKVFEILSRSKLIKSLHSRRQLVTMKTITTRGGNLSKRYNTKTLKSKNSRRKQRVEKKSAERSKGKMPPLKMLLEM